MAAAVHDLIATLLIPRLNSEMTPGPLGYTAEEWKEPTSAAGTRMILPPTGGDVVGLRSRHQPSPVSSAHPEKAMPTKPVTTALEWT